jgi:hypothetical protein
MDQPEDVSAIHRAFRQTPGSDQSLALSFDLPAFRIHLDNGLARTG